MRCYGDHSVVVRKCPICRAYYNSNCWLAGKCSSCGYDAFEEYKLIDWDCPKSCRLEKIDKDKI